MLRSTARTPPDRLVDERDRPYFLWDEDMTIDVFRARLADPDPQTRAYFLGKLLRQAKPDDVFAFVSLQEVRDSFEAAKPYLGRSLAFWTWILQRWNGESQVGDREA